MLKNKNLFIFLNVAIPLFIGLLIYLLCYQNTYINSFFQTILDCQLPRFYSSSYFYKFLTGWACDILWAYSLTFALLFCFNDFKRNLIISLILSASLSFLIEILQLLNVINGTFDIFDIILEFTANFVAVIIFSKKGFSNGIFSVKMYSLWHTARAGRTRRCACARSRISYRGNSL